MEYDDEPGRKAVEGVLAVRLPLVGRQNLVEINRFLVDVPLRENPGRHWSWLRNDRRCNGCFLCRYPRRRSEWHLSG